MKVKMNSIQEAEKLLSMLTCAEKAQVLEWIVLDLGDFQHLQQGIEKTPGICGGSARIVRTRIPVWTLEQYRRLGMAEPELLRVYPTLRAEDLANAWTYVHAHRAEIDEDIRQNETDNDCAKLAFGICVNNEGYPASLELMKLYQIISDAEAEAEDMWRVVDESGESYLYRADRFVVVDVPTSSKRISN